MKLLKLKSTALLCAALTVLLLAGSCKKDEAKVAVTGVSLDKTSLLLVEKESTVLVATIQPDNASNKALTWTSSNPAVVFVDGEGKITATGLGKAKITVVTKDGGKIAECNVEVIKDGARVSGVSLDLSEMTLGVGKTLPLKATVLPQDAAYKVVVWTSSNDAVAKVVEGNVIGVTVGDAVVTVTTVDGGKTATCNVKVVEKVVELDSLALNKEEHFFSQIGDEVILTPTFSPAACTDRNVVWTSSNEDAAKVENGKVTCVGSGDAFITVSSVTKPEIKATCFVSLPYDYTQLPVWKIASFNIKGDGQEEDFSFTGDSTLTHSSWYYNWQAASEYFEKPVSVVGSSDKWHLPSVWEMNGIFPYHSNYKDENYNNISLPSGEEEYLKLDFYWPNKDIANDVPEQIQFGYKEGAGAGVYKNFGACMKNTTWYMADYWNTASSEHILKVDGRYMRRVYGAKYKKYKPEVNNGFIPEQADYAKDNSKACFFVYEILAYGANIDEAYLSVDVIYVGSRIENYYNEKGYPNKRTIAELFVNLKNGTCQFPSRNIKFPLSGWFTRQSSSAWAGNITKVNPQNDTINVKNELSYVGTLGSFCTSSEFNFKSSTQGSTCDIYYESCVITTLLKSKVATVRLFRD